MEKLFSKYGDYLPKLQLLVIELSDYISYYLLDEKCINNRKHGTYGNRIKDKICKISNLYTPLDENLTAKEDLIKNGKILSSGEYGKIYSNIF